MLSASLLGWIWAGGFGWLDAWRFPIIKHLWTSSMVLWAAGWCYLLLALFYPVIDVLHFRGRSFFFMVFGANAITAYMLDADRRLRPYRQWLRRRHYRALQQVGRILAGVGHGPASGDRLRHSLADLAIHVPKMLVCTSSLTLSSAILVWFPSSVARRRRRFSPCLGKEIESCANLSTPPRHGSSRPCCFWRSIAVFAQTLRHDFVNYDDKLYLLENGANVGDGLTASSIGWVFRTNHGSLWGPMTWLSHLLDCHLYGFRPWGHHLTNLLLHAATTIFPFLHPPPHDRQPWPSAPAAALFAIHPLHVETVAWIAERKGLLGGLFFVLTLAAYVRFVQRPFSWTQLLADDCDVRIGPDVEAGAGDAAVPAIAVGLLAPG